MIYNIVQNTKQLLIPCERFNFDSPPIDPIEVSKDIAETMQAKKGIGLAANQIGILYRFFVINSYPEIFVMFNPRIINKSETIDLLEEGCLSFPQLIVKIKRSKEIRIRFQGPNGETFTKKFVGMTARAIQHEMMHLDGKLFFDGASRLHVEQGLKYAKRHGIDYSNEGFLKYAKKPT